MPKSRAGPTASMLSPAGLYGTAGDHHLAVVGPHRRHPQQRRHAERAPGEQHRRRRWRAPPPGPGHAAGPAGRRPARHRRSAPGPEHLDGDRACHHRHRVGRPVPVDQRRHFGPPCRAVSSTARVSETRSVLRSSRSHRPPAPPQADRGGDGHPGPQAPPPPPAHKHGPSVPQPPRPSRRAPPGTAARVRGATPRALSTVGRQPVARPTDRLQRRAGRTGRRSSGAGTRRRPRRRSGHRCRQGVPDVRRAARTWTPPARPAASGTPAGRTPAA